MTSSENSSKEYVISSSCYSPSTDIPFIFIFKQAKQMMSTKIHSLED